MNKLSKKEMNLAAKMLELASDTFSNHGCNDIEENFYNELTNEEKDAFIKEYHEWNGEPDEEFSDLADWTVMGFLAAKLKQ